MYEDRFGLTKNPFRMTPDTSFLFVTEMHREALVGLAYAVLNRKGFTVLTGEAGVGKSTLLHRILESLPARSSYVSNPMLSPSEFLEYAMLDFGITDVPASKALRLIRLEEFLLDALKRDEVAVLIVDEAQCLSREVLEEIRLLTNLETPEGKLLQIILAGQNELADMLNRQDLRQLKQRISVRLSLSPLSRVQTALYIEHRWKKAGGSEPLPFASQAIERIYAFSRGLPRSINALCDNALIQAVANDVEAVRYEDVVAAARDLDFEAPSDGDFSREPLQEEPLGLAEMPVSKNLPPSPLDPVDEPNSTARLGLFGRFKRGLGLAGAGGTTHE